MGNTSPLSQSSTARTSFPKVTERHSAAEHRRIEFHLSEAPCGQDPAIAEISEEHELADQGVSDRRTEAVGS
jgi:hypothetical protein